MPDRRKNRGAHPKDAACFAPAELPRLRRAVRDLSWLRGRGYSPKAALQLVGNRYALRDRQRKALARCAASDARVAARGECRIRAAELDGRGVVIDGYNVLLTVESALSGAVLLLARDGAMRDLAAMRRHYRKVEQTAGALELVGEHLEEAGAAAVRWLLDAPISNSGRLAKLMRGLAEERGWPWRVELTRRTDRALVATGLPVATADSAVIDRAQEWVNLAREVVEARVEGTWVIDLGVGEMGILSSA